MTWISVVLKSRELCRLHRMEIDRLGVDLSKLRGFGPLYIQHGHESSPRSSYYQET